MILKVLSFIVDESRNKFLILKTKEHVKHGPSKWYTVTGAIDSGESKEDAVKREVFEETGLRVVEVIDLGINCKYKWEYDNKMEDCVEFGFLSVVKDIEKIKLDEIEMVDYRWVDLEEYVRMIDWSENKENLKKIFFKHSIPKTL